MVQLTIVYSKCQKNFYCIDHWLFNVLLSSLNA